MKSSRRVKMTQALLKQSLIELLEHKNIRQISIKEICDHANVSQVYLLLLLWQPI